MSDANEKTTDKKKNEDASKELSKRKRTAQPEKKVDKEVEASKDKDGDSSDDSESSKETKPAESTKKLQRKNTSNTSDTKLAKKTATKMQVKKTTQKVSVQVISDSLVVRVIESKDGWSKLVALIVSEIKADPEAYGFQGGLTAIKRRIKLLAAEGLKIEHLKWFVATCEMRGHRLVSYAKKSDASAAQILSLHNLWKFKGLKEDKDGRRADPIGSVSVVAAKVALADLFIAYRIEMGPASFNGEAYKGSCPVEYQWLGSMAAMYNDVEDNEPTDAIQKYISDYEDFQKWYIDVRNKAAKKNNNNKDYKAPSKNKRKEAQNKSRSYYYLALSSFSLETRRAWSNGRFNVTVEGGELYDKSQIDAVLQDMTDGEYSA